MTMNKNDKIDHMMKQLKKAEFFFECMKELSDKMNNYDNKKETTDTNKNK